MLDAMAGVLMQPRDFFKELATEPSRVKGAAWIVLLAALISATAAYFIARPNANVYADTELRTVTIIFVMTIAFVTVPLIWLGYGLVVRLVAGAQAYPWRVTAYALVPQIVLSALLILIGTLIPVEVNVVVMDPQQQAAELAHATELINRSILGRSSQIATYLGLAWWAVLIFIGVRETASSRTRALLATCPIVLLTVGSYLISLFWPRF